MIQIKIGSSERELGSIRNLDESWINQQIGRRKQDGQDVCVQVHIKQIGIDIRLRTPACQGKGRPKAEFNEQEQRLIDLWIERGLNRMDFTGGNVIAFLGQIKQILS